VLPGSALADRLGEQVPQSVVRLETGRSPAGSGRQAILARRDKKRDKNLSRSGHLQQLQGDRL